MHNLPKSYEGKTFADVSKLMNKVAKERPNDIISKNTIKDHMNRLMMANDSTREAEESAVKAMGGNLYDGGGLKPIVTTPSDLDPNWMNRASAPIAMRSLEIPMINSGYNVSQKSIEKPVLESNKLLANAANKTKGLNGKINLGFLRDPKSLRYAPIAFDALAATGLFGKSPNPETYNPTLIQNQGQLTPEQIDEMQMRNATDAAYQTGVVGLSEASGGSGAALRAGLSGLNADYIGGIGKAYAAANQANIRQRQAVNQFNLQNQQNIASQNAQLLSQADQYNNQLLNQNRLANFNNKMDYLAKGAEGIGDIGYEARNAEIMPRLFGYDQHGNYVAPLSKKACGGRLRLRNHKN